ncbi:hypothetical protein [Chelativorans salis]|uniref:Uncharacterized protein n=1 Tax=Chelativorans salis TaxID=2978478 RepID=A0ABT2LLM0_9HYPH|nr:hypothetical protein [Chelativorans sp. EGI FJ00035]MCT7375465.1 hypothetical protein [Chelativorans sp. EGI FJ00035]
MDRRNWAIVAIAVLIIVVFGFMYWPTGDEPTASQEEPATEEPAEPEAAD